MQNCSTNAMAFVFTVSLMVVMASLIIKTMNNNDSKHENFTAVGWVYNRPPSWYLPAPYNPNEWLVTYNIDSISNPECMHYRGDHKELNYMASAYRLWRQ